MRKINFFLLLIFLCSLNIQVKAANNKDSLIAISPNGQISVHITNSPTLKYSVFDKDQLIINDATIDLIVDGKTNLAEAAKNIKSIHRNTVNTTISVPVSERRKNIPDNYKELTIQFKAPYSIRFRVFNNCLLYTSTLPTTSRV